MSTRLRRPLLQVCDTRAVLRTEARHRVLSTSVDNRSLELLDRVRLSEVIVVRRYLVVEYIRTYPRLITINCVADPQSIDRTLLCV